MQSYALLSLINSCYDIFAVTKFHTRYYLSYQCILLFTQWNLCCLYMYTRISRTYTYIALFHKPCNSSYFPDAYFTRESNAPHSDSRAAYPRFSIFIHRDRMHACMRRAWENANRLIRNSVLRRARAMCLRSWVSGKAVSNDTCVTCVCGVRKGSATKGSRQNRPSPSLTYTGTRGISTNASRCGRSRPRRGRADARVARNRGRECGKIAFANYEYIVRQRTKTYGK